MAWRCSCVSDSGQLWCHELKQGWSKQELGSVRAANIAVGVRQAGSAEHVLLLDAQGCLRWLRAGDPVYAFHSPAWWQQVASGVQDCAVGGDGTVLLKLRGAKHLLQMTLK